MTSTSSVASNSRPASLTTTIAGTLICLQWGFTWGAYFSKHWMDSHLQISIGWQSRFLPWIDKHTDFVIDEQSVFTLADNLKDDKEYVSLAGLWICSVLLPCVFMIVCPIWILTDYSVPRRHQQHVLERTLQKVYDEQERMPTDADDDDNDEDDSRGDDDYSSRGEEDDNDDDNRYPRMRDDGDEEDRFKVPVGLETIHIANHDASDDEPDNDAARELRMKQENQKAYFDTLDDILE